jgi:hypothetical protein
MDFNLTMLQPLLLKHGFSHELCFSGNYHVLMQANVKTNLLICVRNVG